MPYVGLFWLYKGRIISDKAALDEGEPYGSYVNGPRSHDEYWPRAQARYPGLRPFEYLEIPRGRVLYSGSEHVFYVYLDRAIDTPANRRALIREFGLECETIRFKHDHHYTTDKDDLRDILDI